MKREFGGFVGGSRLVAFFRLGWAGRLASAGRVVHVNPSESSTLNLGVSTGTVPELHFSHLRRPTWRLS
jgi:hypothetical protein